MIHQCDWGFFFEVLLLIKPLLKSHDEGQTQKCGNAIPLASSSLLCCARYLISKHAGDILVGRVISWKTFVSIAQRVKRQLQR